jgi:hypothetical protein
MESTGTDGSGMRAGEQEYAVEALGFVEFWPAGATVKGEFHCSECGYGVIVSRALPICPMCSGVSWEASSWSPLARAAAEALAEQPVH